MSDRRLGRLVPRISRHKFDYEASEFLKDTCPEALCLPMAVPIERIATEVLKLTILEEHLSEDLSILGQMCFTDGRVEIYDPVEDEYREILVKAGTMIIDPKTSHQRNVGSKRNTIAHECFHWTRHRFYHIEAAKLDKDKAFAYRCPTIPKNDTTQLEWTDEDWMEWQATNIAPRILMPKETIGQAMEIVLRRGETNPFFRQELISREGWIIEQVAGIYKVSKQAAQIRLQELGYIG